MGDTYPPPATVLPLTSPGISATGELSGSLTSSPSPDSSSVPLSSWASCSSLQETAEAGRGRVTLCLLRGLSVGTAGNQAGSLAQAAAHFPSPGAQSSFRCVEAIGRVALACSVTVTSELSAWPTQQWAQRLSTRGGFPECVGGRVRPQPAWLQETASSGARQPQVSRAGGGGNFSLESCSQMEESRSWDLVHFTGRRQNLRAQEQRRLCGPRRHAREAQGPHSPPLPSENPEQD